jgi:hypothetical protein
VGEDGGSEGDRGWGDLSPHQMVNTCAAKSPGNPGKHTNLGFFGGWADGRGVYWPGKRSSWIANALENFAARRSPSLCKI